MLFIALIIALAAAVFAAVVLAEDWGGATYAINGFGHLLGHLTLAGIFLSGIIITAIFFLALWMASLSSIMRRRASNRRRAENRAVRQEREDLVAERDRLARELEAERATRTTAAPAEGYPPAAPPAGAYPTAAYPAAGGAYPADRPTIDLDERERLAAYDERAAADQRAAADEEARRHTV